LEWNILSLVLLSKVPPSLAVELLPARGGSGALGCVLERSRRLCLQLYNKEVLTDESAIENAHRC